MISEAQEALLCLCLCVRLRRPSGRVAAQSASFGYAVHLWCHIRSNANELYVTTVTGEFIEQWGDASRQERAILGVSTTEPMR